MADFEPQTLLFDFELETPGPLFDEATALLPRALSQVREAYPHGPAWNESLDSRTADILSTIALAVVDVELQKLRFVAEADPSRTSQLLPEWETSLGLPDPCLGQGADEAARRSAILTKLAGQQGFSTPEILALLSGLGYTVTLQHFDPWTATFGAGELMYGEAWVWVLGVHYWGALSRTVLECALRHRAPAQVVIIFFYGELTPADAGFEFFVPPIQSLN